MWGAVLGDEKTGIPGQSVVGDFPLGTLSESDRFANPGKMIAGVVTCVLASSYGAVNNVLKTSPCVVTEHLLKVTGEPKLDACVFLNVDQFFKAGV